MKGDGGVLSRSSFCSGAEASSRRKAEFFNMGILAHLSRNGLSMLAGGGSDSGGAAFSLERLRNFERAYPAMGLRFGSSGSQEERAGSIGEKGPDLQKLTTDECWRLILQLGTQWPTWNGAAAPAPATERLMKEKKAPGSPLQRPQDFLELIATRALEALAQTPPDHYGKTAAGGMLAPKQTTQEVMDSKTPAETSPKVTEPAAKAPSSSPEVSTSKTTSTRPRTAALTIFYDGIVNVCDNIPADKARLIMMFAEKAGVSLNAQALLRNVKCVTPPRQPSSAQSDDLQHSTTSTNSQPDAASPSDHVHELPPLHVEAGSDLSTSSSDHEAAAECSNSESAATLPFKFTMITTSEANSRHHVTVKPLPNARKNSLARFLDSRKRSRGTASCFEGGSPKKQALGDHGRCLSVSDNYQEFIYVSGKSPMQRQDSTGMSANCHNMSANMRCCDEGLSRDEIDQLKGYMLLSSSNCHHHHHHHYRPPRVVVNYLEQNTDG